MSSATISGCGRFRYTLERDVTDTGPASRGVVLFVMLNPSTADATADDATVRRCLGFARAWGYGRLLVGNLYAYRATYPRALHVAPDPVGPDNDAHLAMLAARAALIVCAWGQCGPFAERPRAVCDILGRPLHALAFTKGGHPRHPLRLSAALTPRAYR